MYEDKVKLLKSLGNDEIGWQEICINLNKKGIDNLKEFADKLGIDTKGKTKKQLCMEISIQYQSVWIPKFKDCPNNQISGQSFENVNSYLIIRDKLGKCYSIDDLLIISGSTAYEKNIVFENELNIKQAIDLLNKRHIQLEIDFKHRGDEINKLKSSMKLKNSFKNPLKSCVEMLNGSLNDTNTDYIKNLSRLVEENDINKLNEDTYDDITQVIHKYDLYNETDLVPFVENKIGNDFCLGLINIFEYIRESRDYFNLNKIKNEIANIIRSYSL